MRAITSVLTRTWPLFAILKFVDLLKLPVLITLHASKAKPVKRQIVMHLKSDTT